MDLPAETVETLGSELEGLVARIEDRCATIAKELRKPPPLNDARLVASARDITRMARIFDAYFQKLTRAQRAESERLRALADGRSTLPPDWQVLNTRAGLVRNWLNLWPRIETMLGQQMPSRRRRLYPAPRKIEPVLQAQIDISDRLLGTLHSYLNPRDQSETARDHGCFEDIGLSNSQFLEHAHAAYRVLLAARRGGPTSFVDVGCGAGLKVLSAAAFFDRVAGVEFDRGYAASARRLLNRAGPGPARIIQTDALKFLGYRDFDVVYFYRPMRELDAMVRIETAIVEAVRPGTLLIAPYLGFHYRHTDHGCPKIAGSVFLARSSKREATRIRRLAEYTGTYVHREPSRPGLRSIWEPILAACRANGFGMKEERVLP